MPIKSPKKNLVILVWEVFKTKIFDKIKSGKKYYYSTFNLILNIFFEEILKSTIYKIIILM